jgi:hypothetical protein
MLKIQERLRGIQNIGVNHNEKRNNLKYCVKEEKIEDENEGEEAANNAAEEII